MSQASASRVVKQATFLGHPIGLYILFFTEMWERFSYYGMRALLILYMVNFFRYDQKEASSIYKIYTSLVYVTPILGGYLADRFLGNKRAVIIGASLMAIGHFMMAFEAFPIFIGALIFLILGNGFFKPNMYTQVGRLYPPNDGRLDGAYTIFYMGINLGAFGAPLVCGWLADNTVGSYHSGFTMAGVGMVCGLVIYLLGQPWVREIAARSAETTGPAHIPAQESVAAQPAPSSEAVRAAGPVQVTEDATHADPHASRAITEELVPYLKKTDALTEQEASQQSSVFGKLIQFAPPVLYGLSLLLLVGGIVWLGMLFAPAVKDPKHFDWYEGIIGAFNPAMLGLGGSLCLFLIGYVCGQVRRGMRDRVLAILVLGIFVMLFWLAGEQAGNVLNIWADKNTDRYITSPMKPVEVATTDTTEVPEETSESGVGKGLPILVRLRNMVTLKPAPPEKPEPRPALGAALGTSARLKQFTPEKPKETWSEWALSPFNPVSTPSFQAINPLAIFVLAPLFAYLWIKLDKIGKQPSIPMKMVFGLGLMCLSIVVMVAAGYQGNKQTTVPLQGSKLPAGIVARPEDGVVGRMVKGEFVPFHAGLLKYNATTKDLEARGVLPDTEADAIIGASAPEDFVNALEELKKKSKDIDGTQVESVEVQLKDVPPGFDMSYSLVKPSVVKFDAKDKKLIAYKPLAEKEEKGLKVAAGDPDFRATIHQLYIASNNFRVSSWWLFWSYILATLGELCLSPVGLSMVSKLSPAKFATMMMGVWMLTSAFGNFAAGALGEDWGTTAPIPFFIRLTIITGAGTLILLALVRIVTKTMHGVK